MVNPSSRMLQTIPFFQSLSPEELEALATNMWIENYRRGEPLAGRRAEDLTRYRETAWFVYQGVVSLYTLTSRGGRNILFFLGPGALLNQDILHGGGQILAEAAADALLIEQVNQSFEKGME